MILPKFDFKQYMLLSQDPEAFIEDDGDPDGKGPKVERPEQPRPIMEPVIEEEGRGPRRPSVEQLIREGMKTPVVLNALPEVNEDAQRQYFGQGRYIDQDGELTDPPTPVRTLPPPYTPQMPKPMTGLDDMPESPEQAVQQPSSVNTASLPKTRSQMLRESVNSLTDQYLRLQNMDPRDMDRNKDSRWKNMGKSMLIAMSQIGQVLGSQNVSDKDALYGAAGTAVGGALAGLIDPYNDERAQIDYESNKLARKIDTTNKAYQQERSFENEDYERARQQELLDIARMNAQTKQETASVRKADVILKGVKNVGWNNMTPEQQSQVTGALDELNMPTSLAMVKTGAKVKKVDYRYDPATKQTLVVVTDDQGQTTSDWLKDKNGNVFKTDSEDIVKATITAQARIDTANIQATSAETVANIRARSDAMVAQLNADTRFAGLEADKQKLVADQVTKMMDSPSVQTKLMLIESSGETDARKTELREAVRKVVADQVAANLRQLGVIKE